MASTRQCLLNQFADLSVCTNQNNFHKNSILVSDLSRSMKHILSQYFELILCSEHTVDRSAHVSQNKSRRHATHHFELIRLPWTYFKSIGLHSFDGDFNHVFHLHDRNAVKGMQ